MCDCLFALQKKAKEFGKQKSLENVDAKAYIAASEGAPSIRSNASTLKSSLMINMLYFGIKRKI